MIWREFHHGYLGLALLGASWAFSGPLTGLFGAWLVLDDVYQHYMQYLDPEYRSPLHRAYVALLWLLPPVQALNRWLDRLFR